MSDLKPNQCFICFNQYDNERIPLILSSCFHTYCNECISKIFDKSKKEIICPECKQTTKIHNEDIRKLPRNKSLLDLKNYNDDKKKKTKRNYKEILNTFLSLNFNFSILPKFPLFYKK